MTIVFRRRANAAAATRKNISSSFTSTAGFSRTGITMKVLSTFGGGVKQAAGTSMARYGSHIYRHRIASGPQPSSPGDDRILSATSFWTIRARRLMFSPDVSSRVISGVVM